MRQIVYFSIALGQQAPDVLLPLLVQSRIANRRAGITGLLVTGAERYLQLIEGPEAPLEELWGRIRSDPRHRSLLVIHDRFIADRRFQDWSMAYRREPSLGRIEEFPGLSLGLPAAIGDPVCKAHVERFAEIMLHDPTGSLRLRA